MIPKGNQRGGGRQLATHLLNQFDNDHVEVVDLRGAVAQDLHGAFHEWFAQSKATKCQKYLYSLSVNPDLAKYNLTREQYLDFIARTERSLKLVGQPRAVVCVIASGRARMCIGLAITLLAPLFPRHHRHKWPSKAMKPDATSVSHNNRFRNKYPPIPCQLWALRCMDGAWRAYMKTIAPLPDGLRLAA
jgi:hypothetical protein